MAGLGAPGYLQAPFTDGIVVTHLSVHPNPGLLLQHWWISPEVNDLGQMLDEGGKLFTGGPSQVRAPHHPWGALLLGGRGC